MAKERLFLVGVGVGGNFQNFDESVVGFTIKNFLYSLILMSLLLLGA